MRLPNFDIVIDVGERREISSNAFVNNVYDDGNDDHKS